MKYAELMDRIELTPEMRERVLANVEHELQGRSARRPFALRRVLALAACLALVIAAAVALPEVIPSSRAWACVSYSPA